MTDLASLKLDVNELDIDKFECIPFCLSNVVDNAVIKKMEYNKLVTKVTPIETSGFLLKTQYNTDK